ncbi:PIG-L family deacetylase [Raineyella sp. LH-20]|uniref:PIG-L deacetylase family protein n=1 Tax=Raineyella sp. LH-20 TaxID=3081204 RepID=UPI002953539B|nr:PIG-L family deacetylase [Raineyella sp. LH-20]WOP18673.1 PIG-L family deacetylase [Raineyella sp. LH-20]
MTGTFAVVVAHPDDDALTWAGTVAKHAREDGFRFVLVQATDGEAGHIRDDFPATRESLGVIRRHECVAAWRAVGRPPDRLEWLGLPDGRLAEIPHADLVDRVAAVLASETPEVVATFGPDGVTGHPDHIAVGAAVDAAFARLRADGCPGLRRLLHHVLPQSEFDRWQQRRRALDLPPFDPTSLYHWRGVPDDEIGLTVDCRTVVDRVMAGIEQHHSQLHVLAGSPADIGQLRPIVAHEWATVVWPPPVPGVMLCDIFDGC